MFGDMVQETEKLLQEMESTALAKAGGISVATGLTWYDLEEKAKMLYPVRTPLRNEIPRVGARGPGQGPQANWKVITGINTPMQLSMVEEGKRGAAISIATANKSATYKGFGYENPVTFEADYASRAFDDVKEISMLTALQSLMIAEEQNILHGNTALALGTTPTPTVTNATTGGSLGAATYYVYCCAMSYIGTQLALVGAGGVSAPGVVTGLVATVTRTNQDGTTTTLNGGMAKISSAAGNVVVGSGSTNKITASVAAVQGAYAYGWFIGTSSGAANALLTAITYNNTVSVGTLAGAGTQKADGTTAGQTFNPTTDYSTNALSYDGLLTQGISGSGYYSSLDGGTLTADGAGGIAEWDAALQYFWDNFQASPTQIICSSQQIKDIKKKIVAGGSTPVFRINLDNTRGDLGSVVGSARVGSYLNQFALGDAQELPVRLHPYMPPGKVFFDLQVSPYPNANIGEARAVRTRQDYYAVEWPLQTRQYQYGVYLDSVLQVYIPFLTGILDNIGNG